MALFFAGKSKCPLCGKTIEASDDVFATRAFLRNTHRLARFSDAVFHRQCFECCSERIDVERLLTRHEEIMRDAPSTLKEYEKWAAKAFEEFG
jgi:hypothetical protein